MRVEKILAQYGLTLDEVSDLLEIQEFKDFKEARDEAKNSDSLAFQISLLDDKLAQYLEKEEVRDILEDNRKEVVETSYEDSIDDFLKDDDNFWKELGVDEDDESARVRAQTTMGEDDTPPVVMPSEKEEMKDEFYVKTFYDVGIGTFLTILGEGITPQVDDAGNLFLSRGELNFKAFMDGDAKSFRQIALNGQKVTIEVFSENQDLVKEAVFGEQTPQVIVKGKDEIQFRELSDVSHIYDTENSLNFTKPFSMVEARTLVTAMNGSKADLTKFILPLGVAIDPKLTQKSNYVFTPKTMYDLADCEEFFKVSVGGYGYITNYCEGNELQHLQFFELAGSSHLNIPYEKGAKSTITLSTIVNKQFNANMQKVLDAPVQDNEPLTLVGFAPALPSQVPYDDVDLLSEQAGYFVLFNKDAGRAIYLPAVIANYFRKYYGEDITFNIGQQSGPNGEMVIVFKAEDDIVGFHIVQREHAPVTQVARLLLQNQTKFMHDVQTEFASAFENKIDLEQAMGVETKYTFKDEVFEEIVKKPKKARKSKPKAKKKAVKKGKSEAEQIQDIIDELREIILLFDVTDDAEEIAEIEGEIEVLNDIREELISEEADDPMELDEEELTEDEEMVKDILESPEPQDIEEMVEVSEGISFPTPSGMDMEAMVEAEDDDDLFADLFDDEDSVTPEPEEVISPDTIAEEIEDEAQTKFDLVVQKLSDANVSVKALLLEDERIQLHLGFNYSDDKADKVFDAIEGINGVEVMAESNAKAKKMVRTPVFAKGGKVKDSNLTAIPITGSLEGVDVKKVFEEAYTGHDFMEYTRDERKAIGKAEGFESDAYSATSLPKNFPWQTAEIISSVEPYEFLDTSTPILIKKGYDPEKYALSLSTNFGKNPKLLTDVIAQNDESYFDVVFLVEISEDDKKILEQSYPYRDSYYAKGGEVKAQVEKFMATDPSDEEIEKFYMREVLPHDKRSISEIMAEEKFAEGGQVKPVTLDFEYEGKPVSITFTPESGEFKTHHDSDNPDVRFHIDYDEDYGSISVSVYPDEDSEEEIVFRQDIKPEDNMFYFGKGGRIGDVYRHKHIPTMTFEITGETKKGYKGIQRDPESLSKLQRTRGIKTSFTRRDMDELWEREMAIGGVMASNAEIQKIVDAMTDKEVAEKVTNLIFSSLDSLEGDMTASEAYDYALENIEDAREHLVELADAMDLKDELK